MERRLAENCSGAAGKSSRAWACGREKGVGRGGRGACVERVGCGALFVFLGGGGWRGAWAWQGCGKCNAQGVGRGHKGADGGAHGGIHIHRHVSYTNALTSRGPTRYVCVYIYIWTHTHIHKCTHMYIYI